MDMQYFNYGHLTEPFYSTSKLIFKLAMDLSYLPDCAEKSAGYRKLLEAKDCFVRASIGQKETSSE